MVIGITVSSLSVIQYDTFIYGRLLTVDETHKQIIVGADREMDEITFKIRRSYSDESVTYKKKSYVSWKYGTNTDLKYVRIEAKDGDYTIYSNAVGFKFRETPQDTSMANPMTLDDVTPELIITPLAPEEYPPQLPNNGFLTEIYDVSSTTEECPPDAVLTLSYANADVEAYGVTNLRILRYDPTNNCWSALQTTVDTENCTVSAPITELGIYTISSASAADTEAPTVYWETPDENATLSVPTTLKVEASDNVGVAGVTFYLDDVLIGEDTTILDGEWSVPLDCSRIVAGTHSLKAIAKDLAGNAGIATRSITVQSNAIAPCITISSVLFDMATQLIAVAGTATDGDGHVVNVSLKLDNEPVGAVELIGTQWTGAFDATLLTTGTHTLIAVAVDDAGNTGSASVSVSLPLSMVRLDVSPESPQLADTPITLTASSAGGTTIEYHFLVSDGTTWTTLQAFGTDTTCIWTPTTAGDYTVKVLAREQGTTTEFADERPYTISSALTAVSLTADPASPCSTNTIISLTATPTGGANLEYAFQLNDGTGWTTLREYESNPVCTWIPSQVGNYSLQVSAREQGSTQEVTSTTLPYSVTAPPALQDVALAVTPASPQPQYTVTTLTATPTGGGNVEYQFQMFDGVAWQLLRDFTRSNTYEWWPEAVGTYTLRVVAREIGTTPTVTDDATFTTTTPQAITGVDLQVDPASPQPATTLIVLKAVPTNGIQAEFQFLVYNGQAWTTLQEYSADNVCAWTPLTPGTYTLKVTAREVGETQEVFDEVTYTISAAPALSAVTLATDPASPQLPQTLIELSAIPTGGTDVEYQFLVYDGANWTVLCDFAGQATGNWTPTNAGVYTLKVNAREAGTTETVTREIVYTIGAPLALSGAVLSTDLRSPQPVNTEVTLAAAPTGGGSVEYTLLVDDGGGWTTLRGYSTVPTAAWTPTTAGSYSLKVLAREVGTTQEFSHQITFAVQPTLTAVSIDVSPTSPQPTNKTITLTGTPTGGAQVEYLFQVNDGTEWSVIQEYSSTNTCAWIPNVAGTYTLKVSAREMGTTQEYSAQANFTATTPQAISGVALTTDVASSQPLNTVITLQATPTNGIAVEYQFEVSDGTTWTTLSPYGATATCPWMANIVGSYTLKVSAREIGGGQVYTATMPYTITLPALSAVTLETTPASPQLVDTGITLIASSTGGTTVEYRFQVFDGQTWTTIRDYAADNTAVWAPATANTYGCRVYAREVGTTPAVASEVLSYVIANSLTAVSLAVAPASPQAINTPITLTATPTGGANIEYQFLVDDGGGWIALGEYASSSSCQWTPTVADTYLVKVVAREVGTFDEYSDDENYGVTP